MKRFLQFAVSLLMFTALTSVAASSLQADFGIPQQVTVIGMVALAVVASVTRKQTDIQVMGVQVEVWVDYIVKKFRKANSFLNNFYSDDQYVVGGKTVHINQPGSDPSMQKNPTVFPLTATQRTDTVISYDLDLYVTNPTHILDADKQEISYDKMDSVIGDHLDVINTRIAEEHLIKCVDLIPGSTNVLYTTGSAVNAKISGQTGQRKAFSAADLKAAVVMLKLQNIPIDNNLFLIIDSNSLDELTTGMDSTQWNAFNQYYNASTGQIGRLYGVNIFERSAVAIAAAALSGGNLAVNAYGAATAGTDLAVNVLYHKNSIARAMGEVMFYENIKDALYLGDVYSATIRYGGRRRYSASTGVIAIAQGTP